MNIYSILIAIVSVAITIFVWVRHRKHQREAQNHTRLYNQEWLQENLVNQKYSRPAVCSPISSDHQDTYAGTEIDDPLNAVVEMVVGAALVSEAVDLFSSSDDSGSSTDTDIFSGGDGDFGGGGASGSFD
jgi:uncharacterized membrane protein YgcG